MTFLDLVRKVGELGRAKCHPDCDIVVHRREAAMYMGVLRENPELLRELAATLSSGVSEGKAESGERIPGRDYCPLDGEPLWLRIQSGGKPQLYIHADRLTWHTDVTDKVRTAAWEYPFTAEAPGSPEAMLREIFAAQPPAPADAGKAESGERIRVTDGVVAIYRPDRGSPGWPPIRNPWHCYNTYDGSFIECRTDADVAKYRELPAAQPPAPADEGKVENSYPFMTIQDAIETAILARGVDVPDLADVVFVAAEAVQALWAAPQSPAPADDAAEVLAGLLAGFEHERWWSADDEVKFEIWTKAMKRVEAAQQRLADRGQSGGAG